MSGGHELEEVLREASHGELQRAYLFAGDEFLVRKAAEELVKLALPDVAAGLNYVVMDGASPREVGMELATLPLFPGPKVVMLRDPEFLAPKKGRTDALSKAREAWRSGRRKEGARRLLALAARAGWGAGELDPSAPGAPGPEAWQAELNVQLADVDVAFLKEVAAFCREENLSAPEGDVTPLLDVLGKDLPKGQMLVVAASDLDGKNPLVRWIAENGRHVERKVASKLKDLDLSEIAAEVLGPSKKKLSRAAEGKLKERCGGNMRLLQSELEKLALYVDGPLIEEGDVELLVAQAREEEFLELSDALQKKDLQAALKYVDDAVGQGTHPLQLIGAVASITRSLLENHERLQSLAGGTVPRSYDQFKAKIFPRIEEEAKAAKGRVPHPFAAFSAMKAASQYGRVRLLASLVACAEADFQLKSSAGGKMVVERLLWTICG
ncbi:MAG TPA: DNA polymerase III subunit delta [Myxococcales bacterium]|nr:DNA polymerase III subunit delta [Myxococcales bacterium]